MKASLSKANKQASDDIIKLLVSNGFKFEVKETHNELGLSYAKVIDLAGGVTIWPISGTYRAINGTFYRDNIQLIIARVKDKSICSPINVDWLDVEQLIRTNAQLFSENKRLLDKLKYIEDIIVGNH